MLFDSVKKMRAKVACAAGVASSVVVGAGSAFANVESDAVFAAADLAGFQVAVGAIALVPIGLAIVWAAVRQTKRGISYT